LPPSADCKRHRHVHVTESGNLDARRQATWGMSVNSSPTQNVR
jgi:hypothetical protein